jgi:hypothetical protein
VLKPAAAAVSAQVSSLQAEVEYLRGFLEQLAALQDSLRGSRAGSVAGSVRGTPAVSKQSSRYVRPHEAAEWGLQEGPHEVVVVVDQQQAQPAALGAAAPPDAAAATAVEGDFDQAAASGVAEALQQVRGAVAAKQAGLLNGDGPATGQQQQQEEQQRDDSSGRWDQLGLQPQPHQRYNSAALPPARFR